ncbi:MAG: hypothetical protein JW953_11350, partial [Anaerolineae bacterium]|nr:hypothetical protein [Anaerolineae bacterium]
LDQLADKYFSDQFTLTYDDVGAGAYAEEEVEAEATEEPTPAPPTATPAPEPTATPEPAADTGFTAPEGKALFVFYNNSSEDFNVDVGPQLLQVPAGQVGQLVLDPGTYTWKGHSPGGGFYITDANGNTAFEITVTAGQVFETGVQ